MCKQNASYLAKHSDLQSKKFNKIYLKIIHCSKVTISLQHVKFQKFSGVACRRTPLELFLLVNQLQISFAENNTHKKCENCGPPPFLKFLATPLLTVGLVEVPVLLNRQCRHCRKCRQCWQCRHCRQYYTM